MPGKFYEDLEPGDVIVHRNGRTLTELDNVLFSSLTMNTQPLHLNEDFASQTQFGQRIVNGIFTMGLAIGLTVSELTEGTIVANLSYEEVKHPRPMFHGDTLYVTSEVVSKRESRSKRDRGLVVLRVIGKNQHGETTLELLRTVLFKRREPAAETVAV